MRPLSTEPVGRLQLADKASVLSYLTNEQLLDDDCIFIIYLDERLTMLGVAHLSGRDLDSDPSELLAAVQAAVAHDASGLLIVENYSGGEPSHLRRNSSIAARAKLLTDETAVTVLDSLVITDGSIRSGGFDSQATGNAVWPVKLS